MNSRRMPMKWGRANRAQVEKPGKAKDSTRCSPFKVDCMKFEKYEHASKIN